METKGYKNEAIRLFAHRFKKVGVIVILASIIIAVLFKLFLPAIEESITGLLLIDLIITGLFIIAVAKEKIDDERIMFIRLKAIGAAFSFAIIYTLVAPFVPLLFGDLVKEVNGQVVILSMLIFYHIWFWIFKRSNYEKYA